MLVIRTIIVISGLFLLLPQISLAHDVPGLPNTAICKQYHREAHGMPSMARIKYLNRACLKSGRAGDRDRGNVPSRGGITYGNGRNTSSGNYRRGGSSNSYSNRQISCCILMRKKICRSKHKGYKSGAGRKVRLSACRTANRAKCGISVSQGYGGFCKQLSYKSLY